ncbi:hypothetical protein D3C78_1958020 [compost metagenome]
MKKAPQAAMPSATDRLPNSLNTLPEPGERLSAVIDGRMAHCQANAIAATGTRQKKAPRQPMTEPR